MVASSDVARATSAYEARWEASIGEAARGHARTVVDLDAEENLCPACGASFRTAEGRCGDCGLKLG